MRRPVIIGVSLLGLAASALSILGRPGPIGHRREQVMPSPVEILLVSGTHPNEACAPLTAREVFLRLRERGQRVALHEIPYRYTLLALIDDSATAVTDYAMPAGERRLDVDLDGLDADLRRRHPGALIFEFHNSEDTSPMLGIDPARPTCDYQVGVIGPGPGRSYEIGTWRNVDDRGRHGKYLIELPACYVPEELPAQERRHQRLAQLRQAGYDFNPRWSHYLESRADVAASRRRGYLDDCLARKVADWIMGCLEPDE